MPLVEISLPDVVPPEVFPICVVLAVVAVGFVLVEIGFIIHDYLQQRTLHDSETTNRRAGDEMV